MKFIVSVLSVAALSSLGFADEKTPDAPKPAEPPKAAEPAAPSGEKIYAPTAIEELKPLKGKKVTLEGPIVKQGENKAGSIRYLNFTDNFRLSVSLTFFANAGDGKFTKEKLAEFVGKKVRVTGELTEFNGMLQIKMTSLEQLKVVE